MLETPPSRTVPTARLWALRGLLTGIVMCGVVMLAAPGALAEDAGTTPSDSAPSSASEGDPLVWSVKPTDNEVGTGRPNFGYRADPGASITDALDVTNRSAEPLTLKVYAADAFTPAGGGIDLLPAERPSTGVGTWITISTDTITVAPQETVAVPFTLTVPTDATPGDHSGGIVTSITTGSGQFAVEQRLGSRMHIRVAGDLNPVLEISDVSVSYGAAFNPFSSNTATVSYTVTNNGNVRLNARQKVTVAGPFGILSQTVQPQDIGEILVGSSRDVTIQVPAVWAFFYISTTVTLEPFPTNPNDATGNFAIGPVSGSGATGAINWGHVILVFVIAGAAVGSWWLRKRGKAKTKAAIDQAVEKALTEKVKPAGAGAESDGGGKDNSTAEQSAAQFADAADEPAPASKTPD